MFVCKFLIDEGLEVHVDSLEMDDQIMGRFAYSSLL